MADSVVSYVVSFADWLPVESDKFVEEDGLFKGSPIIVPSDKEIDERTIRSYVFNTLEEAEVRYNDLISEKYGAGWKAYVKIERHMSEVVKKYPEKQQPKCEGCDGSGLQSGQNEGCICNYCDAACVCDKNKNECLVHREW